MSQHLLDRELADEEKTFYVDGTYWRGSSAGTFKNRPSAGWNVSREKDDIVPLTSAKRLFEVAKDHLVMGLADVFPRVCEWIEARTLIAPL